MACVAAGGDDVAWRWLLALLGLGCIVVFAWSTFQMVRHPYGFDADLIRLYERGEIPWPELERRQRFRRRQHHRQR
jgi:hypothetical protein